MPPSPNVHRFAVLENRYFEEHSTNDLHFADPEHLEPPTLLNRTGEGLDGLVGDFDSRGQCLVEQ